MGRRGCGVQRSVVHRAKVTLLPDKTKFSNGGDRGGTSPTRGKEEHSCTSEDSGRSFYTPTLTRAHAHIYPVPSLNLHVY